MINITVNKGFCFDTWLITEAESKAINSMKYPCFICLDKNNKVLGYYFAHSNRGKGSYEGVISLNGLKTSTWRINVRDGLIEWFNSGGNIEPKTTTCIVKDFGSFLEETSESEINLF